MIGAGNPAPRTSASSCRSRSAAAIARRCRAAAAWCRAMISSTVSDRAPTTRTPSAKRPSGRRHADDGLAARQRAARSRRHVRRIAAGAARRGPIATVASVCGSRYVASRRPPQRTSTMPPAPGPSGTSALLRASVADRVARATTSAGSVTIQRAASACRRAAATVSGMAAAKSLAGTPADRSSPSTHGSRHTARYPDRRVPASRQSSRSMPTSAVGRGAAQSTSCVFRRNAASSDRRRRSSDTRTATRCDARGRQRRGRAGIGNEQTRAAAGVARWPASAATAAGRRRQSPDEDFECRRAAGDEQRLSRRDGEDDTGSTGHGLGAAAPAARARSEHRRSSAATVAPNSAAAYNERLVMNLLPSQGADRKGLV